MSGTGVHIERDGSSEVRARIRKLLAMNSAAGCTQAEAAVAAAKAAELMAAHGLSADEALRPPIIRVRIEGPASHAQRPWISLWPLVAEGCGCGIYLSGDYIVYCGFEPDALVAEYMHGVALGAMQRGRRDFLASREYKRRRTRKTRAAAMEAYLTGFSQSLCRVLIRVLPARSDQTRKAAIAAYLESAVGQMRTHKVRARKITNEAAAACGLVDGSRVEIHSGVTGATSAPLQIGGR